MPTTSVTDFNFFSKAFPTSRDWVLVKIPFKDLVQTIPFGKKVTWTGQDVTGAGFEAVGFVGPFWFEVSGISVY